jgi:hypothetical protein
MGGEDLVGGDLVIGDLIGGTLFGETLVGGTLVERDCEDAQKQLGIETRHAASKRPDATEQTR